MFWQISSYSSHFGISLRSSDVEHLFMFSFDIGILFGEMFLPVFCPFSNWTRHFYCWALRGFTCPRYESFVRYVVFKYFLLVCILALHHLNKVFCKAKGFNFYKVQFPDFFFYGLCYLFSVYRNSSPRSHRFSLTLPSKSFTVSCFTFKSIIQTEFFDWEKGKLNDLFIRRSSTT